MMITSILCKWIPIKHFSNTKFWPKLICFVFQTESEYLLQEIRLKVSLKTLNNDCLE